MAVYKLFPSKDSSIYSFYSSMNTGIDPIIEVGNLNLNSNSLPQVFRPLIKFDQNEINDVVENKIGGVQFSSSLKCFIAQAQGILADTYLYVYPISGSWNNGSGTYLDSPFTTNGVSWKFRTFSGSLGDTWDSVYNDYVTASYSGSTNLGIGGNWFTGSSNINLQIEASQLFDYRSKKDLDVNVTDIVKTWYSSSNSIGSDTNIANEGFIIKWEDSVEFSQEDAIQPIMQFYSVDTNTIYPPVLEIKWDDSLYSSSLPQIPSQDLYAALDNNPGVFYSESINRFRLNVRPEHPVKTYLTASDFTTNYILPSESYWAIQDLDTNEFIVDFDSQFTKISADNIGNYFDVYMNGLEPERYYKILFKTTISGSTIVKDDQYYFKVING